MLNKVCLTPTKRSVSVTCLFPVQVRRHKMSRRSMVKSRDNKSISQRKTLFLLWDFALAARVTSVDLVYYNKRLFGGEYVIIFMSENIKTLRFKG